MGNVRLAMAVAFCPIVSACAMPLEHPSVAFEPIFETNITNDINLSSGEPEIAVDPTNPNNLAIIEFAVGSAKFPAWKGHPLMDAHTIDDRIAAMVHDGRLKLSEDGGKTWTTRDPPALDFDNPDVVGAGDPMIAYGPDGTLYAADEPMARDPAKGGDTSVFTFVITASTDGGKTFSQPQQVPTPIDRPCLKSIKPPAWSILPARGRMIRRRARETRVVRERSWIDGSSRGSRALRVAAGLGNSVQQIFPPREARR